MALLALMPLSGAEWRVAGNTLTTRSTAQVRPDHALPEYPRPQMVRTLIAQLVLLASKGLAAAVCTQTTDAPFRGPDRRKGLTRSRPGKRSPGRISRGPPPVFANPFITYSVIMVRCGPSAQANCDPRVSSRH
jgi:hypothetical protein